MLLVIEHYKRFPITPKAPEVRGIEAKRQQRLIFYLIFTGGRLCYKKFVVRRRDGTDGGECGCDTTKVAAKGRTQYTYMLTTTVTITDVFPVVAFVVHR